MPPKKRKTGTLKQNKQPVSSQKKAKKVEVVEEAIVEKTVVEKVSIRNSGNPANRIIQVDFIIIKFDLPIRI